MNASIPQKLILLLHETALELHDSGAIISSEIIRQKNIHAFLRPADSAAAIHICGIVAESSADCASVASKVVDYEKAIILRLAGNSLEDDREAVIRAFAYHLIKGYSSVHLGEIITANYSQFLGRDHKI